jgi:glycosyltransferase A (GT-A) superfamily protein (DUF2064 family)
VRATVVILTKLPGHLPIKTRLQPLLGEQGAIEFHLEALASTIRMAHRFDDEPLLATSPVDADPESALPNMPRCKFMPVAGDDGATCLENALKNALSRAHAGQPLVALGADSPDLPPERIEQALGELSEWDAVFVPTSDGGFSCLVLREPISGLAQGFRYGGTTALASLKAWMESQGLKVQLLEPWEDVDTPEQYRAYSARRRDT